MGQWYMHAQVISKEWLCPYRTVFKITKNVNCEKLLLEVSRWLLVIKCRKDNLLPFNYFPSIYF
jgi:hypothetical protein